MAVLLAIAAAVAAVFSYRVLEDWSSRSWLPAGFRAAGWGTLTLLLLNASCPTVRPTERPAVLLDASLSMQAAGGRWQEALALARHRLGAGAGAERGAIQLVGAVGGEGDTTASGGHSRLAAAVAAAQGSGRRVIVITDGEVEDAAELQGGGASDSLQGPEIHVLPRRSLADVALTRIEGTSRVTPSDSLRLELELSGTAGGGTGKRLLLVAREGSRVWLSGSAVLDAGGRATAELRGAVPAVAPGPHVLSVAIVNAADSEPRDDERRFVIRVMPTPGIVLLASPPTWESRFLLETLRAVAALPVRGYLETERGVWRRAGDLHQVTAVEVANAVRHADLLVSLGASGEASAGARARGRWSWPGAGRAPLPGDWYVTVSGTTPVSGAFAGLAVDSFPPGTAIVELSTGPGDWVGLTAQAGRRGNPRPVLIGRDSARVRTLVTGIEGLWRWAFQGGSSEQAYRSLVAASVSWLLGGADSLTGRARLQRDVVQRGRPASFEWSGSGAPEAVPIELSNQTETRRDTLRFGGGGEGRAELQLPPGVWRYRLSGGGEGILAVEQYSDEWVASRPALSDRPGSAAAGRSRRSVRNWVWLFGVAVLAFAGEWYARRRLGLR